MRRLAETWALLLLPGLASGQVFVEVTATSGARNAAMYCTGAVPGDYDGDGDLDLYVTNWGAGAPANALYENDGGGVFVDVAAARGVANIGNSAAAAWADFDNDGDLDLYVADFYEQDYLYQNEGGAFVEVGRTRGTVNMVRQGAETCVAWGDYDNDGWADIYIGKYYYRNELYHNRGDGTFEPVMDLGVNDPRDTHAVDWVDYDGDGWLDLYVVNREQANTLFHNVNGSFAETAALLGVDDHGIGQDAAWADYDGDGDLDLLVANVGPNALYRNDGPAGFVEVGAAAGVRSSTAGWITVRAAWADYDGDGDLDLYLANGGDRQSQPDVLLASDGAGSFADATAAAGLPAGGSTRSDAVWADLDGDGSPDLYLTDGWGYGSRVFRNRTPGAAFVRVGVRGLGAARGGTCTDAVGAQVRLLEADGGRLRGYQQVQRGSGAPLLHFGATPGVAYRLAVRYPRSGRVATVEVAADARGGEGVIVTEPEP